MNKKNRLIFGVTIVVVLLGYLFLNTVTSKQYEVSDAVAARETLAGKPPITVNGTLVPGTDKWDPLTKTLTFKMTMVSQQWMLYMLETNPTCLQKRSISRP